MTGAAYYLGTAHSLLDADAVTRPDRAHGSLALPDEPRRGVGARDAQFPHLLVSRAGPAYAAVSQVEAEQIRIISMRFREPGTVGASGTRGAVQRLFRVLAPIAQRRSVYSGRHANAAQAKSVCHQIHRVTAYIGAIHNRIVACSTDKTLS